MKTQSIKFAAATMVTFGICATIAAQDMPKMVVGTAVAQTVDHTQIRKYSGRIAAIETVAVVPQVAGEIKSVNFKEGADVKQGDILYIIDKVKYEAAAASARATVAQARSNADYASKTFDRTKALYEKKVASDDDLDSATTAKGIADASLAAAEANLVSAEDNLAHCTITAPISGKIGLNKATVGNYVTTASGALTTIVSTNPMRLVFSMSARDFMSVYGGDIALRDNFDVRISLADGQEYPIAPVFDFADNTANASTDTVTLYYTVGNEAGSLIPGMSVKISISSKKPQKVLTVPISAVIHDKNGSFVFVLDDHGIPQRREIETGGTTTSYEIVSSGIVPGETVVSRGTHKVYPGMPVNGVKMD